MGQIPWVGVCTVQQGMRLQGPEPGRPAALDAPHLQATLHLIHANDNCQLPMCCMQHCAIAIADALRPALGRAQKVVLYRCRHNMVFDANGLYNFMQIHPMPTTPVGTLLWCAAPPAGGLEGGGAEAQEACRRLDAPAPEGAGQRLLASRPFTS